LHKNLNEVVFGQGHANVLATHKTTLEFTKEKHLSKMGDCIATVATDKAVADLNEEFKKSLANDSARLTITIEVGPFSEKIQAHGSSRLTLTHRKEMVIRKSDYVCSRTLAVCADKGANELNRSLVEKLKDPEQKVRISLAISF
jgi:hypothetical protein